LIEFRKTTSNFAERTRLQDKLENSYIIHMPEITRFYGIIIKMLFIQSEHPPPHIHAIYGEYISAIDINECKQLAGDLPDKALALVLEWVKLYKSQLLDIWETQKFRDLPPLK
jgi:hypothetical protein